jgi:hypothetical protein
MPTNAGDVHIGRIAAGRAVRYALAGVLLVFLWQSATVRFNYGGNWTALFCTGDLRPVPAELGATYVFAHSDGYDGQFYRYVAHDPWARRGWSQYLDAPPLRRGRILLPAAAWLLAGGQDRYIDAAYISLVLLSIFLGIYWLGRWSELHTRHPAWGLGFILLPATLISVDRMTADVALAAACAGTLWYAARGCYGRVWILLAGALLTRETGLVLVAGCCAYALSGRCWRRAAFLAASCLPAFAWFAFVARRVVWVSPPGWLRSHFDYPAVGIVVKLFRPEHYPFAPHIAGLVQAADVLALLGILLAVALAVRSLRHRPFQLDQWLILGFLGLVLVLGNLRYWNSAYNHARLLSPLLYLVSLRACQGGTLWTLAPVLLVDLRIATQWVPQLRGVLRGIV